MIRVTAVATLATLATIATLGLALGGCKKKEGPAGDDCAVAVNHMMDVQLADLSKAMDAKSREQATAAITAAKASLAASCKQMKWSKDAIDCVKAVKNNDDAASCNEKLTKEQRDAAEKVVDIDSDMAAGSGAPTAGGATGSSAPATAAGGSPAPGSASTGSAAGGSAAAGNSARGSAAPGNSAGGSAALGSASTGSAAGGSAAPGSAASGGAM